MLLGKACKLALVVSLLVVGVAMIDVGQVVSAEEVKAEAIWVYNGRYKIVSALPGDKLVDMKKEGNHNVTLWQPEGGDNAVWMFEFRGYVDATKDGYVITNQFGTKLVLDSGSKSVTGYPYHGGANQVWTLEDAGKLGGEQYYYIKSKLNGKVLDVKGSGQSNGTDILVWANSGTSNQKFKLVLVKEESPTYLFQEVLDMPEGHYGRSFTSPRREYQVFFHNKSTRKASFYVREVDQHDEIGPGESKTITVRPGPRDQFTSFSIQTPTRIQFIPLKGDLKGWYYK